MKRIHLFEFTDQSWYPQAFRRMQTEYLQFVTTRGAGHKNLVPLFEKAFRQAGTFQVVDLCSGGTGPWVRLYDQLRQAGLPVSVTLTDKFPSPEAIQKWAAGSSEGVKYYPAAVDAINVPGELIGMRTMFEGFHHFKPGEAGSILRSAFESRAAIGIFEASLPRPFGPLIFLLSPLMTLLGYLFVTPIIRPHRWARYLWTYLIPLVPLATCWDGLVSFLRVYPPEALTQLVEPLKRDDYHWEIGTLSTGTPLFMFTYLLGYPQ